MLVDKVYVKVLVYRKISNTIINLLLRGQLLGGSLCGAQIP